MRKHESPILDAEPLLAEFIVIPILDYILDVMIGTSRSLKLLHLPKAFKTNQSTDMRQFIERYNHYISSFRYSCSRCERLCSGTTGSTSFDIYDWTQNYTCSNCLKHFCFHVRCTDDNGNKHIEWCRNCERYYCKECVPSSKCWGCNNYFCNKCDTLDKVCDNGDCDANLCKACTIRCSCRYCNETKCMRHSTNYTCTRDGCDKEICADCVESKGEGGECNTCGFEFCSSKCQYLECIKDEWERTTCTACKKEGRKYQEGGKEIDELPSHLMWTR